MKRVLAVLALCCAIGVAIAASQVDSRTFRRMEGYDEICATLTTTDGTGAATLTIRNINGRLCRMSTSPSTSYPPSANWDLTLVDDNSSFSVDLLQGSGADRSDTSHESYIFAYPSLMVGDYTLTGANMGATTGTTVFIQLLVGK